MPRIKIGREVLKRPIKLNQNLENENQFTRNSVGSFKTLKPIYQITQVNIHEDTNLNYRKLI
jgi:hypothetical protein